MSTVAIYPGSFDPITVGHIGVFRRALTIFDELHLLAVHNPAKQGLFTIEERLGLMRSALKESGIDDTGLLIGSLESGLLVDYARKIGASAIVKGFRTSADIEYELPMAQVNRDLSAIETVFLPAEAGLGFVSSSLVKQVAELGGEVNRYVTPSVANALFERFSR